MTKQQQKRVERAQARMIPTNELNATIRIKILDARLGNGVGAKRERERLHKLLLSKPSIELIKKRDKHETAITIKRNQKSKSKKS